MNCRTAVKEYIGKMLEIAGDGMKAMLMDRLTTQVITQVYTMSQMAKSEVFLLENLQDGLSPHPAGGGGHITALPYVKAIIFVQPSEDNIRALCSELQAPKFGKYYIFFTNIVSRQDVKLIAESDRGELVEQLQQYYCDFLPLGGSLWTVPASTKIVETTRSFTATGLTRCRDSLYSYLASLNKVADLVRHDSASPLAKELAKEFLRFSEQASASLTKGSNISKADIYIMDRRCDAITPLLQQWSYRAMLHEVLGIQRGQVDLSAIPSIDPDMQKIVLDPDIDTFYADNMLQDWGTVSTNAQTLIQKFQKEKAQQQKIDSIADMKAFLERYPAFKHLQSMTSRHLTLIGELQKRINGNKLMKISEYEQNLVTGTSNAVQDLAEVFKDGNVKNEDCIRLCALYAARDLATGNSPKVLEIPTLKSRSVKAECTRVINQAKKYQRMTTGSTLGPWGFGANGPTRDFRSVFGMGTTENVYTQHKASICYLMETIKGASQNNPTEQDLLERTFPCSLETAVSQPHSNKPVTKDVVIFIVGGWTYEEALAVYKFNQQNQGKFRVCLSGTECLNSRQFLHNINKVISG